MKRFARLYREIDETTRTNEKVAAMARYFTDAPAADAAWAVWFLSGGRPKRLVPARRLAAWAMEASDVREWLFDECYDAVGDLAETISLLLPAATATSELPLHVWVEQRILGLAGQEEDVQRVEVLRAWTELDGAERYIFDKLITGGFRVGVSQALVLRALAKASGIDEGALAHRLTGTWEPTPDAYARLVSAERADVHVSQPYPFYLAYALEGEPDALGDARDWQAEWKWDGIRAQVVRRQGRCWIWSRGEELVTERFPELSQMAGLLPDGTVLDGEILPWRNDEPLGFAQLQRRIGRKVLGAKILAEVPVVLVAYDLLERDGSDVRERPLSWRRAQLEQLVSSAPAGARARLVLSPIVRRAGDAMSWADVHAAYAGARDRGAEGLMLKRLDAPYGVGRRRGGWWKWKVAPYTVDAVLVYAQAGSGRRASLHTDYTFAVWDGDALVPFAKAYSGLTDAEIRQVDAWVRRNTIEKFGPVRSVPPEQVFELAFEGIQRSPRHKSGIAVRFPRILRWRTDKPAKEADSLETLRGLLEGMGNGE